MDSEQLLTIKDVAALMQVSTRTVQRYIELGRFHPVRLVKTGALRFRRRHVLSVLEKYEYAEGTGKGKDDILMG